MFKEKSDTCLEGCDKLLRQHYFLEEKPHQRPLFSVPFVYLSRWNTATVFHTFMNFRNLLCSTRFKSLKRFQIICLSSVCGGIKCHTVLAFSLNDRAELFTDHRSTNRFLRGCAISCYGSWLLDWETKFGRVTLNPLLTTSFETRAALADKDIFAQCFDYTFSND